MEEVTIVIPIYKETLTPQERGSLLQCNNILSRYNKCIVAPEDLDLSNHRSILDNVNVKRFPKYYFSSIDAYSELCLSEFFYTQFSGYQYMLIYQLDCWVFRDELIEWCNKGYDYIGAPWFDIGKKGFWGTFSLRPLMLNKVGNGGFSLRKVETMISVSKPLIRLFKKWRKNEDFYIAILSSLFDRKFKKPPVQEAVSFAFETLPEKCYELNNNQLPFGCHAW